VSFDAWLTLALLVLAVLLFISEKLPADVVALLVLSTLLVTGVLSPAQALAGFSSEATITVAAMFVLSAGIQRSGLLRALGRLLARLRWRWLLAIVLMGVAGSASAFINNTAAVAVLLPVVLATCAARHLAPSRFLIPLSYASQMGGVCTLIGTSTNLLVNSLAVESGEPGFGLFEFSHLGLLMMAAGFAYLILVAPWLLPAREQAHFGDEAPPGSFATEVRVLRDSNLIGKPLQGVVERRSPLQVLAVRRDDRGLPAPLSTPLELGDILLVRGEWADIESFVSSRKLRLVREDAADSKRDAVVVEVVIAANGSLSGRRLGEVEFERLHQATLLAVQRRGQVLHERLDDLRLGAGDLLLIAVPPSELPALRRDLGLVVISEREPERLSGRNAALSVLIMAAVVGTAALGLLPITASALIGGIALILLSVISADEAYAAIDWRVIFLLAGMLPLGLAMRESGLAATVVDALMVLVGDGSPLLALAVVYAGTALLTECMSNNAAAVLMTPIVLAIAHSLDVDAKPFLIAVMFAASTSFATPVGYQTNTMVYNAGGYSFSDFMRVGVPLNLLFLVLAVYFIPVYFPFR
jgi:di/tricarboxylate transporter